MIPLYGELNIGFVVFTPRSNGFLSGKIFTSQAYTSNDIRNVITRFNPENMEANEPILELIEKYAEEKHYTPVR